MLAIKSRFLGFFEGIARTLRNKIDQICENVNCACAGQQILALPETQRDKTILALETMEALMPENNSSTEAAFRALSEAGRADDASAEAIAAYESVDDLGERLEDILDAMREAGGACPG